MKTIATIAVCLCLVSSSLAKPSVFLGYQDSIGQYSFGYSDPMSARSEYRASDGVTRGTYSYVDNRGDIQTAEYEAGQNLGFRVRASNLPTAPLPIQDTPEVMAAREKHLKLLDEIQKREDTDRMMNNEETPSIFQSRFAQPQPMMIGKMMPKMKDEKMDKIMKEEKMDEIMPEKKDEKMDESMPKKKDEEKDEMMVKMENEKMMKKDMPKSEEMPQMMAMPRFSFPELVQYTPEVAAAREAHFKAYETAAKLAIESDRNPLAIQEFFKNTVIHAPTLLKEEKMDDKMDMIETKKSMDTKMSEKEFDMKFKIGSRISEMKDDSSSMAETKKMDTAKESYPMAMTKMSEKNEMGPNITPASTSLRITDTRLPSLNEFEQAKLKAGTIFTYNTDLKVKDFEDFKPIGDQRLLITKTVEFAPKWNFPANTVPESFQLKNWGFQYMYI